MTHVISRQYEMTCYIIIARKDSQTAYTGRPYCINISENSRHVVDT